MSNDRSIIYKHVLNRQTRQQFDSQAEHYVISTAHSSSSSLDLIVELAKDSKFQIAADIGTGPGFTAFALAEFCDDMIATDITSNMLNAAANSIEKKSIDNISVGYVDAMQMSFIDNSLDLISCRTAAHHFSSLPLFLGEVYRVLKTDGVFLLSDTTTSENPFIRNWHQEMEFRRDNTHIRAPSPSEWRKEISQTGFVVQDERFTTVDMTFREWVERSGTHKDEVKKMWDEWLLLPEQIKSEFNICKTGKDFSFSWPVYLARCVKT